MRLRRKQTVARIPDEQTEMKVSFTIEEVTKNAGVRVSASIATKAGVELYRLEPRHVTTGDSYVVTLPLWKLTVESER